MMQNGDEAVADAQALLLVAHGSARYPNAAAPLLRHLETLRAMLDFSQVEIGLLNGDPTVQTALNRITAPSVCVVPFFMEAGYFSNVAIPQAIGNDPRVRLCPPVGTHPHMADIIDQQGRAAADRHNLDLKETALLIVGHGSARAPGRALAMYDHAANVAARGGFANVSTACLEEAPTLADALENLRAQPVIVIGYFAGEGLHMRDDVPAAITQEQQLRGSLGAPVIFHGSVADDPTICAIIAAQANIGRK